MTITLDLVAMIFLGWLQPNFFYVSVIFGLPYSKIALRSLKHSYAVISFRRNHVPTHLHFIPLSSLASLPNGVSISCNVSLPQPMGMVILSLSLIISLNEMRIFLHSLMMAELLHFFVFNHIISRFGVPQAIVIYHESHFQNQMMGELCMKLGFRHENSFPCYPQENGQVEANNKVLKTMLQRMVGVNKTSWNLQLFSTLWAYQTSVKTTTRLTSFHLVYEIEVVLPIECKIPSLKLTVELLPHTFVEEEQLLYLTKMDETHCDVSLINETYKKCIKNQYDKSIQTRIFAKGDLVLVCDQDHDKLGAGNL
jgi:hypothetical protein